MPKADSAILSGWIYVPLAKVPDLKALKLTLTVKPKAFAKYEPPPPIPCYREDVKGRIGVPIAWGLDHLPESLRVVSRLSKGSPITVPLRPDPNHPRAPTGQGAFMDALEAALMEHPTVLAESGTGTGKTVAALEVAARLGCTVVVQVHLTRLLKQWVRECKEKLGLTDDEIGVVQGERCDYKGKKIVIAMMPTLARRKFAPEFYSYFGFCVQDEVHKVGAAMLSRCLGLFDSFYKLALTATVKRANGTERVYLNYYGPVRCKSTQQAAPLYVVPVPYRTAKNVYTKGNRSIWLRQITNDPRRNRMLTFYLAKMYAEGRAVLGVGEAIDHLEEVGRLLVAERGIPVNDIGYHTNEHNDPETGKRVKTTDEYFEWVRLKPRIILGTYGTLTEGIDIPRLNGGVDLTPRGKSKQLFGRIRRTVEGKPDGVWYTPVDLLFPGFVNAYYGRLKDVADDPLVTIADVNIGRA